MTIRIGTAGWSIPSDISELFPAAGTGLERFAARFNAAEINSSFHRPHRLSTWERWHDSVPDSFRFSVKLPKTVTHQAGLVDCSALLGEFIAQAQSLRDKLAVLLVQLPPKLDLNRAVAQTFFAELASITPAAIACEPRNASWFTDEAGELLEELNVARVAADPALSESAAKPGGWPGLLYWRLHGSPVIYRSSYRDRIQAYAKLIAEADSGNIWCIFDNTASAAGAGDALALQEALKSRKP